MTACKRQGKFPEEEKHRCFVKGCEGYCHPATSKTCQKCNFKKCENDHCACNTSEETQHALKTLYETFCEFCK